MKSKNDSASTEHLEEEIMTKQSLYLGGAALAVTLMTAVGGTAVMADSTGTTPSKLAQAIADKFHLNATDVQGVITQQHQQVQADRQANLKAKLDQAVKDGKLTSDQETALLQKLQQRSTDRATMKADRQALRQWLQDNKIDLRSILGEPQMGMGHGMMRGMGMGSGAVNQQ